MSEQLALLPGYLLAHLQLSLAALLLGAGISIPLGILVTRRRALEGPLLGVVGVIQTIPGLALLAGMVPLLALLGAFLSRIGIEIQSIGYLPAVIALTLYSMLPILRNTVTGIRGIDRVMIEAARGVGMTPMQQLFRVELPLALPVIVAGVRTGAVWVVGTATLSTPVGATSLGNFIFSGLQTRNDVSIALGCISAAALAMLLDQCIRFIEFGLYRRRRAPVIIALVMLLMLAVLSFGARFWEKEGEPPLVIGAKGFTEQFILAEVVGQWVTARTGRPVEILQSLGTNIIFDGLVNNEIDISIDYSGTIWAEIMRRPELPERREQVMEGIRAWLREEHGIRVPASFGFENTYAMAMREAHAESLGISRLTEVAPLSPQLSIGSDYTFFDRAEWDKVRTRYGFAFREARRFDPALMYQAVAAGEVDIISAYSTDGRIASLDLRVIEDDLGVIPPYDTILLASPGLAEADPKLLEALGEQFEGAIDAREMQGMNFAVDDKKLSPRKVASAFLQRLRQRRQTTEAGAAMAAEADDTDAAAYTDKAAAPTDGNEATDTDSEAAEALQASP